MSNELRKRVTNAIRSCKTWDTAADAAIALIRAETLEEAASAMEQRTLRLRTIYAKQNNQTLAPCGDATAIRALKDKS